VVASNECSDNKDFIVIFFCDIHFITILFSFIHHITIASRRRSLSLDIAFVYFPNCLNSECLFC